MTELITWFTLRIDRLQMPVAISGTVDSIHVTGITDNIFHQAQFTGAFNSGQIVLELLVPKQPEHPCITQTSTALAQVRTILAIYPLHLTNNSEWEDSTSARTCAGEGVPISVDIKRSYNIEGEALYAGKQSLVFLRKELTRFTGNGTQGQHQLHIEGAGDGISKIFLEQNTGILTAALTTQKLNITVLASGQIHHFIQEVEQRTSLIY